MSLVCALYGVEGVPFDRRLGWIDFILERSNLFSFLLRLMRTKEKWMGRWASWWNTKVKVNPTEVNEQTGPVETWTTLA